MVIGPLSESGSSTMVMTLGECARAYINSRWGRGEISKETKRSFTETLGIFSGVIGTERRLTTIDRQDIERWMSGMSCSAATKRLRLSTTRGMFQWAVIEGYAKVDPTLGIKGPKKPRSVPRGLAEAAIEMLLSVAIDARERVMLTLMLEEGLRAGEIAGLEIGDVDLVSRSMVVTGKGGHSRPLPVTDLAAEAIEEYLLERGRRSGPLLLSYQRSYANEGDGLTAKYVSRMAGNALRRAALRESGHVLRHTFAHGMIDAGASIRDVQVALGHASMTTTQVYLGRADVAQLRNFMGRRPTPPVPPALRVVAVAPASVA